MPFAQEKQTKKTPFDFPDLHSEMNRPMHLFNVSKTLDLLKAILVDFPDWLIHQGNGQLLGL